ncbi:SDR family NAD(P)-dependent oxidoreductase [Pseudidiomarina mangrovi]|uniref:SDR family NAD(P)-dependent oxidoreductase n=1 Tax=Pseudidiomarina mangrovi TaxID=2487133 RepID=UPI000FCC1E9D|nr:SDR family NAD(P)-dependent oxidoreductase [Pseudidiomarina mangrovi]
MTVASVLPVAIITGAASGLGADLARRLQATHQLVLIDRDGAGLAAFAAPALGPAAHCYTCDLADAAAIDQLLVQLRARYPQVAVLINNAGITQRSLSYQTQPAVMEQVMAVDYFAPVRLTQGLTEPLQAAAGQVVVIGSMAAWMPVLGRAGYCAAKAALAQYFETYRAEVAGLGIRLLQVYPSFLATAIEQNALGADGQPARHARSTVGQTRSSDWMAQRIIKAMQRNQQRLFADNFSYFASLLYRLAPRLYLRLMARRFAGELRQAKGHISNNSPE